MGHAGIGTEHKAKPVMFNLNPDDDSDLIMAGIGSMAVYYEIEVVGLLTEVKAIIPGLRRSPQMDICQMKTLRACSPMPSRHQTFFTLAPVEEAVAVRQGVKAVTDMSCSTWKIETGRIHHRGGVQLLTSNEAHLRSYWEGKPLARGTSTWERMIVPPVSMIHCVLTKDQVTP